MELKELKRIFENAQNNVENLWRVLWHWQVKARTINYSKENRRTWFLE